MIHMKFLIQLFIKTCIETVNLTGMLILIGFLLGLLRNYSVRNFQRSFGSKAVMITGFIGVPIHELSHAIAALLFKHRITAIKLLQRPDVNGIMGYVEHSYNQNSIYQQVGNFFIGIAPIFGGIACMVALMHVTIPETYNNFVYILMKNVHVEVIDKSTIMGILYSYLGLVKSIFSIGNFENPHFYIFLFISICISSHISLSLADIKGASIGLTVIFFILLILNIFGLSKYIQAFNLIKYNILITSFLVVAVILSLITFLISLSLVVIRKN